MAYRSKINHRELAMAQDVILCDVCETSPVQMYCNPCATKLCNDYTSKHITDNPKQDHNIILYQMRASKQVLCDACKTTPVQMYCKSCAMSLCNACCIKHIATNPTKDHNMVIHQMNKTKQDKHATARNQLLLLDSPKSPLSIHTGYKYHESITCLNPDEVWVCGDDIQIKRFTITGSLHETVTTTTAHCPEGITVSRKGDMIYTDYDDRSINRVRHGKIKKIISTQKDWYPTRVCCTNSNELLIAMMKDDTSSRVVRYSGSTEKQVIQFDDQGKPFFSSGYLFIAENSDKDMICVSDKGTDTVVVLNQAGKLRFRYTGNLSPQKYKSFSPRGVVIDSMGHILVADSYNHCIQIIDQQGHFLCYIDNCLLSQPFDLSLDRNNTLYVAEFSTAKVKVIKYLT